MRDPHVVALTYRMETVADESYDDPPPVEGEEPGFGYRLENEHLTVTMKDHFPAAEAAKAEVDPFLRTWELGPALSDQRKRIWFVFENAEVIDRKPRQPGEPQFVEVGVGEMAIVGCEVTAFVTRKKYPDPPHGIVASPDVQVMWMRYEMFKNGREPLASMAYFCLTVLEGATGKKTRSRKAVCELFKIDQQVRDTFGDLVSQGGDGSQARKFDLEATRTSFRGNEAKWIEQVVLALMRRKAEYDFDASNLRPITMSDFVTLIRHD